MADRKLSLPPFAALRAFYAAATHERFRDAADSLGVTESAISHQVKRLEDFLRVALVDRSGGRATLTATGRRYLEAIEPALQQLQAATEAVVPTTGRSTVRLTLPPSLAASWLIPKLGSFERSQPEIDLQLITTTRVVDLGRDKVDLAIRYGGGAWRGLEAAFLLEETAMPVCAPGYLDASHSRPTANLLRDRRLIVNANFPDEWEEWARAHGIAPPALAGAITLDAQEQALQLAEKGHGLAMGRRPVVDDWLEQGRLVAPFGAADPTGASYYLCRPSAVPPTAAARRTERWLLAAAASWHGTR
jgi:LysR family glycine cleavage system transcriptional activator